MTNILTISISLLVLALSALALYLQRRDKKPKLILSIERIRANAETGETDARGFPATELMPVILIHLSNPTDKTITVSKILYDVDRSIRFEFPVQFSGWEILPHKKQTAVVKLPAFYAWMKTQELVDAERCRFVIIDALDNEYKTSYVARLLTELRDNEEHSQF